MSGRRCYGWCRWGRKLIDLKCVNAIVLNLMFLTHFRNQPVLQKSQWLDGPTDRCTSGWIEHRMKSVFMQFSLMTNSFSTKINRKTYESDRPTQPLIAMRGRKFWLIWWVYLVVMWNNVSKWGYFNLPMRGCLEVFYHDLDFFWDNNDLHNERSKTFKLIDNFFWSATDYSLVGVDAVILIQFCQKKNYDEWIVIQKA